LTDLCTPKAMESAFNQIR